MRTKLFVLFALMSLILGACTPAATPVATATMAPPTAVPPTQTPAIVMQTVVVQQTQVVESTKLVMITPTAMPNPEAVIPNVEPNATVTVWTFWLSPTFDNYIKDTIARFKVAYPGVTVKWEDHQATFQDDLNASFAAGNAPDVINLSISEGWVTNYASQSNLLALDKVVPASVVGGYFPNLWNQQVVAGKHYQFPYYQGISVDLINTQIYNKAGLKVADFPKTIDGLPALCKTIHDKTGTLCDIRLTVSDLLAQMTYESGAKVISDDGKSFTFNSPEGVAWLQMYVDMVKAGTVDRQALVTDQDRVGLDLFTSGKAAFYNTGPNLIRDVRANNPGLYGYLAVVNAPVGKSGVVGKGLMAMSVNAKSKFPNAAVALAQFFTNAASSVELSKAVAVYPSMPAAFDDPFFAAPPVAIEDSVKPTAKQAVAQLADIVPTVPKKADVNNVVLQAIQSALFNGVPAQKALDDAVAKANALIK